MLNNERDLVTRLLKQNIVTLCKETVSYDTQLEIDGIICISTGNESQQIVVKVHNFFQKLGNKSPTPRKHTEQSHQSPNDHVWKTNTEAKRYPIGQFNGQKDPNEILQKQLQKYKNDIKLQNETNGGIVDNNNDATSNGYDENHVEHNNQSVSPQIPKTITSLEQDETSFQEENDKGILNESSSGSDTMDYEDNAMNDDVVNGANDNLSNPHIISFHENGDVISEMPGQSPVKMSPTDVQASFIDMKSPRKHSSRDENSMIECKLGKNCNTDEDLSKVPIRQVRDIQCKRCGTILSDGQAFEQHNTDVHSVYTCRVCFNTFTCRNNMKRHMRLHTGFRPYTCKLCSESFTRKDDIKRHLIRHSFDKPFRCNVCRKGYMDRKTVKNHIRKEHHSKIIHICQTCGEAFDNSVKFQDHKKNHPELKMFQCSLCKFTGSNLLTYNKHQLIHEIKKDYCCEPCDLKFGDPFRYTTHLRKHRSDPNFISYRCCFCNLKLSSYDLFMRHEHSHDQSKQFTCFVCMKQFQNDASLKEHKRSHPTYNCGNETPPPSLLPSVIASRLMAQQPIFPSFMSSYSPQGILPEAPDQPIDATVAATTLELVKTEFPKPETKTDIESMEQSFQPTQSTENNDYWCAECQHGFATEEHLTEHIVLAHEGSVLDNDAEVRNTTDDSSRTDKQNELDKIPKSELFEMSDNNESSDELENMEIHENIARSVSPSGIRYTPVPIFSNPRLSKRSKARQESKAEGDCNIQPESIDFKDERSSDSAGVPLVDTGDNSSSPKTDEYYENIKGDKNFHAQTHFSCNICFLSFSDFEPYDLHSSMVHRKYICHFCGKDFTSRPNRDRHVRYHTGEKPFKCDVCHQSFVRGDDLRYHRTSKHPDVKPYTCTICGLSFPWTKDLERHAKTHGIS
ncbi:gastrula zinc finger protein xFG20-1-like [Mytilus trossulus]|uniref:gastrula zinc finger protein xFG20-1-like n=1 Tax=Mytilus trossulus TaxID=6551 RepID=UPI00300639B5